MDHDLAQMGRPDHDPGAGGYYRNIDMITVPMMVRTRVHTPGYAMPPRAGARIMHKTSNGVPGFTPRATRCRPARFACTISAAARRDRFSEFRLAAPPIRTGTTNVLAFPNNACARATDRGLNEYHTTVEFTSPPRSDTLGTADHNKN